MADSRARAEKVQEEPGTSYGAENKEKGNVQKKKKE